MMDNSSFIYPAVGAFFGLLTIRLGVYVLTRRIDRLMNNSFGLLAVLLGFWVVALNLASYSHVLPVLTWLQISFTSLIISHIFHILFMFHFPRKDRLSRWGIIVAAGYFVLSMPFLYVLYTSPQTWFTSITTVNGLYRINTGRFVDFWGIFMAFSMIPVYVPIILRWKKLRPYEKDQIKYQIAGMVLMILTILFLVLILPIFSHEKQFTLRQSSFAVVIYAFATFYAIAKHKLLDITIAFKGIFTQVSFFFVSVLMFLVFVYGLIPIFFPRGSELLYDFPVVNIAVFVVLISAFFTFGVFPVKNWFEHAVGKLLSGRNENTQDVIRDFSEMLSHSLELEQLKEEIAEVFHKLFRVEFVEVKLLESGNVCFAYLLKHPGMIVYSSLVKELLDTKDFSQKVDMLELQDYLRDNRIELVLPLIDSGEIIGAVFVSPKGDSSTFSESDINIVESLGAQISVAIQNARLFEELKRERNIMSAERDQLDAVLASTSDAVLAVGQDNRIVYTNNAAANLLGWNKKELLHRSIEQVLEMYEEGAEDRLNFDKLCDFDQEKSGCTKFNIKIIDKQHREKHVNIVANKIPAGKALGMAYIITLHDITNDYEVEKMKLDFVSLAAHELKTPITILRGYLYYLYENTLIKSVEGKERHAVERSIETTKTLTTLVDNLLNVSRIEQGRLQVSPRYVKFNNLIEQSLAEFELMAKTKGLEFIYKENKDTDLKVFADVTRIGEVLRNLLDNAIKYTEKGSVTISSELKPETDEILVKITDTGKGIPDEAKEKIGTKFYREEKEMKMGSKGTGLGLYITKSIIESHGGTFGFDSELGKGSTFYFTLPLSV